MTAVWGMESFYGERQGSVPVVSALATLAYEGRRAGFFESQLVAALKILQNGDVTPARMTGSWAGAMGHTQFIPTSYLAYAVDFDGDGRRDIWSDDPTDALASTAAYLARSGWQHGQPWGVEVRLPEGFSGPLGRGSDAQPLGLGGGGGARHGRAGGAGLGAGVDPRADGAVGAGVHGLPELHGDRPLQQRRELHDRDRAPVRPAGRRAAGQGSFPPDARGMTIDDRRALQERLTARGFDTGGRGRGDRQADDRRHRRLRGERRAAGHRRAVARASRVAAVGSGPAGRTGRDGGRETMSLKDSFTPEEWARVVGAPMLAGIAVTAAEPGGLWGAVKESAAVAGAMGQAKAAGGDALIGEIVAAYETSEGREHGAGGAEGRGAGARSRRRWSRPR